MGGGTGQKFTDTATWVAGVASIAATVVSVVYATTAPPFPHDHC